MRNFTSVLCVAGALLFLDQAAAAQTSGPVRGRVGMDLLTSGIDSEAAERVGVGQRAWGLQFSGGAIVYHVLGVNAEVGVVGVRDADSFTYNTTEGEKRSSVSGALGSLAVGLQTPPLRLGTGNPSGVSAGVYVGNSWLKTTRRIERCTTCHTEDVELQVGSFVEPVLQVDVGERSGINVRYRVYGGDSDFQDALVLGFHSRLGRRAPAAAQQDAPPAEQP
jgi:hypothetical protein